MKDGPGRLSISEVSGEVRVRDTRGKLSISFVTGNVTAQNNPEGIEIINIDGNVLLVKIPADKSTMKGVQNLQFSSARMESSDPR